MVEDIWSRLEEEVDDPYFSREFYADVTKLAESQIERIVEVVMQGLCCGMEYHLTAKNVYGRYLFIFSYGH